MAVECFAQRLLNPFRGAVHTIRYQAAEAATLDGVHWDIYVANDQLLDGLEVNRWTQVSDIRYGKWTLAGGLKRGPIYPSDDFRRMEQMGAVVHEHLTRVHDRLPFPFRDQYELWLLDAEGQPLALLDSAVGRDGVELDVPIEWHAGIAARQGFASPRSAEPSSSAADYLARYINRRAGATPAAQWFLRREDGGGQGLSVIGPDRGMEGRTLGKEAFPALLLAEHGHDGEHRRLIADFHAWQAPWLLLLPHLERCTRDRLEQQARDNAREVADRYRLYPQVVDPALIRAARVEAMMRRRLPVGREEEERDLSTFYIELNPGPTD